MTLRTYLSFQRTWSLRTFGAGRRTVGITAHVAKELDEIRANPTDLEEWIDVMILAFDGYWRHGGTPEELLPRLRAKQLTNFTRHWPAPQPEDQPTEHLEKT